MKSAVVHGGAVYISYRSVSGGARCFLSPLVRRFRLSALAKPFQAGLKTRFRVGSLGRCGGGSCGLCGSRVHWFVFGGIFRRLPCVHGVHGHTTKSLGTRRRNDGADEMEERHFVLIP